MKNRKLFQRLVGVGCSAVMGLSLVGCFGGAEIGANDNFGWQEDPNFVALDISERERYPGGDGMGDSNLKIANWMLDEFTTGKQENTNIYQRLEQEAGLPIEAWVLGDGDWQTQINNAFNTSMLPDMFVTMGPEAPTQYQKMIKEGVLLPVSDFVDSTTYPNIYNHLRKYNYLRANIPYAGQKHWSIPVKWQMEHAMYVRLDWIENLNNKITAVLQNEGKDTLIMTPQEIEDSKFTPTGPKDILEFYRLARAFTYCDPDGNGLNDTYGYTNTGADDMFCDCWIFEAFGAGYDRMVDSNGDGVYESSYANENTKKALAFMNKMYKDGILHPAFSEHGLDEKQNAFTNGQVGIIEGHVWYNTILKNYIATKNISEPSDQQIEQYSQDIGMFNPPVGETGKGGINGNPNFWTVLCLNAGMDDEEVVAALELMDFLLSPEGEELVKNGIEGTHYTKSGDNVTSSTGKIQGWQNALKVFDGAASIACMSNLSAGYLSYHQANYKKIIAQMEEARKYSAFEDYAFLQPEAYVLYWGAMKEYAQEQFVMLIRDNSLSSTAAITDPTYSELNALANNSNFTNAWNSYLSTLKGQHLEEVETAYNNAIKNGGMKVTRESIGLI